MAILKPKLAIFKPNFKKRLNFQGYAEEAFWVVMGLITLQVSQLFVYIF